MGRMHDTALIVDDHDGFRAMARQLLEDAGFEVVGEAGDSRSAIDAVVALRPSLVLLDVQLPDGNGFAVAAQVARTSPHTAVVLTSVRPAADCGSRRVANAAARGFVPKAELSGTILVELLRGTR